MTERRPEEQRLALECLKLAQATAGHAGTKAVKNRAEVYLAFVTQAAVLLPAPSEERAA